MAGNCLKCGAMLFKKEVVDKAGHTAVYPTPGVTLEAEGSVRFMSCPYCKAKNAINSGKDVPGDVSGPAVSHIIR